MFLPKFRVKIKILKIRNCKKCKNEKDYFFGLICLSAHSSPSLTPSPLLAEQGWIWKDRSFNLWSFNVWAISDLQINAFLTQKKIEKKFAQKHEKLFREFRLVGNCQSVYVSIRHITSIYFPKKRRKKWKMTRHIGSEKWKTIPGGIIAL